MSASLEVRSNASKTAAVGLWLLTGAFGLSVLFVSFLAVMELLNAGENVLIETWPGWILMLAVSSGGVYAAYSELQSLPSRPVVRQKVVLMACSVLLVIAILAMNSSIMFRLTNGG